MLAVFLIPVQAAVDIERYCQSSVAANAERAAWGLELRSQMLQDCEGQNLRICSQPYRDQIIKQERFDQISLKESLKRQPVGDIAQYLLEKANMQKTTAAYMALRGVGGTADEVAQQIYTECVSAMPGDLEAITKEGGSTSLTAPSCPNYAGTDALYRQRCCTPDCYCDIYCQ